MGSFFLCNSLDDEHTVNQEAYLSSMIYVYKTNMVRL